MSDKSARWEFLGSLTQLIKDARSTLPSNMLEDSKQRVIDKYDRLAAMLDAALADRGPR